MSGPSRQTEHGEGARRGPLRVHRVLAAAGVVLALVALTLPFAVPSAVAAPSPSLTRYPYLTDSIQSSVTVNWATDRSGATGSVTWGPPGSCTANTVAATATAMTVVASAQYQWKATIAVSPDTQYCYRVFLGGADLLGGDPSPLFTSQVAAGSTAPYSFAVFGDWGQSYTGSTNPDQANVLAQMAQSGSRFAVMTGDTAYPGGGQSEYGDLHQTGTNVSTVFGPDFWTVPGRSLPVFNVTGNHGFTNGAVQVLNWPEGNAAATSGGRYAMEPYPSINGSTPKNYPSMWYAFDAGGARFYALTAAWADGNIGSGSVYENDRDAHWTPSSAEFQWLQADLASHPGSLKFAFWHYPLYADSSGQPSDTFLQGGSGTLQGLLNQYGVAMVFNGHAHGYQRNRPDAAGMVSYVVGNGGAALGRVGPCTATDLYGIGSSGSHCGAAPAGLTNAQVYGFVKVTVDGRRVTVTPTNSLGGTYDVQTYDFGPPGPPDTVAPSVPSAVSATAVSSARVDVGWSASSDDVGVSGYRVYRDGSAVALATVTGTTFSDTTVAAGTGYSYQVSAFDVAGNESARSDPVAVTTPAAAPGGTFSFAPSDDATVDSSKPTVNAGSATRVTVDNSPTTYALLKFPITGMPACTVTSASLRLTVGSSTNDKSPYGGDLYAVSDSTWSEGTVTWNTAPASVGAKVSSVAGPVALNTSYTWDVTPLVSGNGTLSVVLKSTSGDGARYFSKEGGLFTQVPQLTVTCSGPPDTVAPSVPSAVSATAVSSARVDVGWSASSDDVGVSGYRVYRDGSAVALATVTGTTFSDTTVAAGTGYSYQVSAFDVAGNESARSDPVAVTTPAAAPGGTFSFAPSDDATVDSSKPTVNAGSATRVTVDNSPTTYALLKFPITGMPACTVTSASLRLTVGSSTNDKSPYGGDLYAVSDSTWSEGTVTWNTAPASVGAKVSSVAGPVALNTSYTWDVTPLVSGNGTLSVVLKSTSGDGARYFSKEGGLFTQVPQLTVTC